MELTIRQRHDVGGTRAGTSVRFCDCVGLDIRSGWTVEEAAEEAADTLEQPKGHGGIESTLKHASGAGLGSGKHRRPGNSVHRTHARKHSSAQATSQIRNSDCGPAEVVTPSPARSE